MKTKLFLLSLLLLLFFTYFSYTVAKERWQKTDFDTTVKLQDHISSRFDGTFSYFSLLGSAEVTIGFCLMFIFWALLRRRWLEIIGWLMIIPASAVEIFGKLVVFHPGPPVLFHRSILHTSLPSFYVHTNFSYPSGHMTRTIFIITVFALMMIYSSRNFYYRFTIFCSLIVLAFLMALTRVYLGEHWLSDVIGGTFLGMTTGFFASILILRNQTDQGIDFTKTKGLI
ncbi:phosphatase PAP2 family protein [Patescibacteria group bacterium]|nr:phosphatase PAP2 family protein [Patescibacteria group bacterium]